MLLHWNSTFIILSECRFRNHDLIGGKSFGKEKKAWFTFFFFYLIRWWNLWFFWMHVFTTTTTLVFQLILSMSLNSNQRSEVYIYILLFCFSWKKIFFILAWDVRIYTWDPSRAIARDNCVIISYYCIWFIFRPCLIWKFKCTFWSFSH